MRVEVWSDIACPWCYVGKRHLEAALEGLDGSPEVAVTWRSFQLDPSAAGRPDGDYRTRLARKYRVSEAEADGMIRRMVDTGAASGLDLRFDLAGPGNTFDAHRLLHLAASCDIQDRVKERLLAATFTEGALMSDHGTLVRLGAECGLGEAEVREMLAGDAYAEEVRADFAQARAYGIDSVPFFVIDGRYGIRGAQPATVIRDVLQDAGQSAKLGDGAPAGPGCEGEACEA